MDTFVQSKQCDNVFLNSFAAFCIITLSSYSFCYPFSVQLLKSSDLGRHSLLYLKELGHGWFGKVNHASCYINLYLYFSCMFTVPNEPKSSHKIHVLSAFYGWKE